MIISGTIEAQNFGRKPKQQRKWEKMDRFEKTLMKKSIAENMMSSTHVNGGFSAGPHIGTIRHVPSKKFFSITFKLKVLN